MTCNKNTKTDSVWGLTLPALPSSVLLLWLLSFQNLHGKPKARHDLEIRGTNLHILTKPRRLEKQVCSTTQGGGQRVQSACFVSACPVSFLSHGFSIFKLLMVQRLSLQKPKHSRGSGGRARFSQHIARVGMARGFRSSGQSVPSQIQLALTVKSCAREGAERPRENGLKTKDAHRPPEKA